MDEDSWLRQILDNAERDVENWPSWLQKLRENSSSGENSGNIVCSSNDEADQNKCKQSVHELPSRASV